MSARRRRRQTSSHDRLAGQVTRQLMRTKQGRQVLAVLVVLMLLASAGYWVWDNYIRRKHPIGPTVRLASWNLRQFSERENIDLDMIARIIRESQFDLVAIQEVKQSGQQVDRLLNVLGAPWRSTTISPRTGNAERFTFLYNGDHLQPLGSARFISHQQTSTFDRTPYQASFRAGQFDFTVITVHLSYSDVERRKREAQDMARIAIDVAASSAEKDIIVLGDFNEQGRGNAHYFEDNDWEVLIDDPTNLSSTETYDLILIEPEHTSEWSGIAGAINFDDRYYRGNDEQVAERVSDHRPVYADFVTNLPDDD